MADDKTNKHERDRNRVAAVITRTQAMALIQEHGNDRSALLREPRKLGK